jgi:hypothetical protein
MPMTGATSLDAVAQKLRDHIEFNTDDHSALRESIKDVGRLLMGFIAATFLTVVAFAGYIYAQAQTLASQLARSRAESAAAIAAIPDATARRLELGPVAPN